MKGIYYLVDDSGKKNAIMIDLKIWGNAWEEIFDILVSRSRRKESSKSWERVKKSVARNNKTE